MIKVYLGFSQLATSQLQGPRLNSDLGSVWSFCFCFPCDHAFPDSHIPFYLLNALIGGLAMLHYPKCYVSVGLNYELQVLEQSLVPMHLMNTKE